MMDMSRPTEYSIDLHRQLDLSRTQRDNAKRQIKHLKAGLVTLSIACIILAVGYFV